MNNKLLDGSRFHAALAGAIRDYFVAAHKLNFRPLKDWSSSEWNVISRKVSAAEQRRTGEAGEMRGGGGRRCGILIIILGREVPAKASQMRPAPVWHNDIVPTAKNLPADTERGVSEAKEGVAGWTAEGVPRGTRGCETEIVRNVPAGGVARGAWVRKGMRAKRAPLLFKT